jgi:rubrerythrin
MMYDFSAKDVFLMAQQMEKNGAEFYKTAAHNAQNADTQKLLLDLASMEEGHEKTFVAMRGELTEQESTSTVFDPEGEAILYLKALADSRVFFEKEIDVSSQEQVYKAALGAEKDSIVFYLGMKDMIPEKGGKARIDAIIKEEMGHIETLSRALIRLKQ